MYDATQPLRAVIYVPRTLEPEERYRSTISCDEHRQCHGYAMVGLLTGEYTEISQLLAAGQIDVVVIADEEHLPPDRLPRIEVAGGQAVPQPEHRVRFGRSLRTRFMRRSAAA